MVTTRVFMNNRMQAVRLPKAVAFPDTVKEVDVLVVGQSRVIVPKGGAWDWYFSSSRGGNDDFMPNGREQPPMPPDRDWGPERDWDAE